MLVTLVGQTALSPTSSPPSSSPSSNASFPSASLFTCSTRPLSSLVPCVTPSMSPTLMTDMCCDVVLASTGPSLSRTGPRRGSVPLDESDVYTPPFPTLSLTTSTLSTTSSSSSPSPPPPRRVYYWGTSPPPSPAVIGQSVQASPGPSTTTGVHPSSAVISGHACHLCKVYRGLYQMVSCKGYHLPKTLSIKGKSRQCKKWECFKCLDRLGRSSREEQRHDWHCLSCLGIPEHTVRGAVSRSRSKRHPNIINNRASRTSHSTTRATRAQPRA